MPQKPLDGSQILELCDRWTADRYLEALDQRKLHKHYNGGDLPIDGETQIPKTNQHIGARHISRAVDQLVRFWTAGKGILDVKLRYATDPFRKLYIEGELERILNHAIVKQYPCLAQPYKQISAGSVIYGKDFIYKTYPFELPRNVGQILTDKETPGDPHSDRFLEWAFAGELSAADLQRKLRNERGEYANPRSTWNQKALKQLFQLIAERHSLDAQDKYSAFVHSTDWADPDTWPDRGDHRKFAQRVLTTSIPVYWFFQKNLDTGKIDVACVARTHEKCTASLGNGGKPKLHISRGDNALEDPLLTYRAGLFDSVDACLFPFVLDFEIGKEPRYSRVQGLGHKIYDRDVLAAWLINVGLASVEDDLTPLYTIEDSARLEELRLLMKGGFRRHGVLPAEITPVDRRNVQQRHDVVFSWRDHLFGELGQESLNQTGVQNQGQRRGRELEVNAIERQNETQFALSTRMSDWLNAADPWAEDIGHTILNPNLIEGDQAWETHLYVMGELLIAGIAPEEVEPDNVIITAQRLPGNGDQQKAVQQGRELIQLATMGFIPPQSHPAITRGFVTALTDDAKLAAALVPEADEPDQAELMQALTENIIALGGGTPPPLTATEVPETHAQIHDQGLQTVLQIVQQNGGAFEDLSQMRGFQALAAHQVATIKRIGLKNPKLAQGLQQQLQGYLQFAQRAAQELQRRQAAQSPEGLEQRKLAVQEGKLQLQAQSEQRQAAAQQTAQQHRETQAASQEAIRFGQERRADRKQAFDEQLKLAELSQP